MNSTANGASPRARGTRPRNPLLELGPRFIPARAGWTTRLRRSCPSARCVIARPRRLSTFYFRLPGMGVPDSATCRVALEPVVLERRVAVDPLDRGDDRQLVLLVDGLDAPSLSLWPRSFPVSGSSPPLRGAPQRSPRFADARRFFPACAGSSSSVRRTEATATVHPRWRGAEVAGCATSPSRLGCVPRVRGEDWITPLRLSHCSGSSPRVRGGLLKSLHCFFCGGCIPASAGVAAIPCGPPMRRTVHPRFCRAGCNLLIVIDFRFCTGRDPH